MTFVTSGGSSVNRFSMLGNARRSPLATRPIISEASTPFQGASPPMSSQSSTPSEKTSACQSSANVPAFLIIAREKTSGAVYGGERPRSTRNGRTEERFSVSARTRPKSHSLATARAGSCALKMRTFLLLMSRWVVCRTLSDSISYRLDSNRRGFLWLAQALRDHN